MKITNQIYPNHNLANETERGENLAVDFILSSILGAAGVAVYFLIIEDYKTIPFKIKATAFLIYLLVRFVYYFTFELLYSRTPGKFQTQSKVVNKYGEKPSVFQLLTRSLSRFISVFSGISDDERAVHDTISNTFVVQDSALKRVESRQYMILIFNVILGIVWLYYFTKMSGKSSSKNAVFIALILVTIYAALLGFRRISKKRISNNTTNK
jgi:uncharacterized RDD family membrane protein YckC